MSLRRWSAVLLISMDVLASRLRAQAQSPEQQMQRQPATACETTIPANVDAGLLAPDMIALLRRSGTFRGQCERIADLPRVRIHVGIVYSLDHARALTSMRREGMALVADVQILFGDDYRELLAHEFEHVLEQLDGVSLSAQASAGRAWRLRDGAFESRRAMAAGARVLRECELAATLPLTPRQP